MIAETKRLFAEYQKLFHGRHCWFKADSIGISFFVALPYEIPGRPGIVSSKTVCIEVSWDELSASGFTLDKVRTAALVRFADATRFTNPTG
jgi:hypothetical protein